MSRNFRFNAQQVARLVRSGGTQRFHTEVGSYIKTQDVAQHSYGVFWLCLALTNMQASRDLLICAIGHDAGERWVGDMPAPTKRALEIRPPLHAYEESRLRDETSLRLPVLSEFESDVLKLADGLDGLLFSTQELRLGNRTAEAIHVAKNFLTYVSEAKERIAQIALLRGAAEFNIVLLNDLVVTATKEIERAERE